MSLFILLLALNSWALRTPPTFETGKVISSQGFIIDYAKSSWQKSEAPSNLENQLVALFKLKDSKTATLTVRVDPQSQIRSLREYTEKWIKSFSQYGLEVLGHQSFKNKNDIKGMVIDLLSENSKKKIRQVIYFKDSKAIVMTCMDQNSEFTETLKKCNELIQNFDWIESGAPTEKLGL